MPRIGYHLRMVKHACLLLLLAAVLLAAVPGLAGCRKAQPSPPPQDAATLPPPAPSGAPGVEHPVLKPPESAQPQPGQSGTRELYVRTGCSRCHGTELAGSDFGPPLKGLKANWTSESLVAFLKDPVGSRTSNVRLAEEAGKYKTEMPAPELNETELKLLADWLLTEGG